MIEQTEHEPWYLSQGYFNAKMNERTALALGQAVLDNIAAGVRAEMAEGRIGALGARAAEIEDQINKLQGALADREPVGKDGDPTMAGVIGGDMPVGKGEWAAVAGPPGEFVTPAGPRNAGEPINVVLYPGAGPE